MGSRRLVVMARWPAAGRCKGRLRRGLASGPLTEAAASRSAALIQAALTVHTLAVAREAAGRCGAEVLLAGDGLGPRALARWGEREGVGAVAQGRGSLGLRMQRQLWRSIRAGIQQLVIIGSDLPRLETADLTAAFEALASAPLVLGPASDGGYWLLGLSREGCQRAGSNLMAGIPWGGSSVLQCTLTAAAGRGLTVRLLRQQNDLDGPADLAPWGGRGG